MTIELLLLTLWLIPVACVRFWVSKTLERGFAIESNAGGTGAEVAAELLKENDVASVRILRTAAPPRDCFDARRRELRLSARVHDGRSLASEALAAFETSPATRLDAWALARAWTLPIADLIAGSAWIVLLSGIIVWWPMLAHLGLDLLNASLLLGLLTLPAELIAARHARTVLAKSEATTADAETLLDTIILAAALRPIAAPLNLPLWPFGLLQTAWKRAVRRRRKS